MRASAAYRVIDRTNKFGIFKEESVLSRCVFIFPFGSWHVMSFSYERFLRPRSPIRKFFVRFGWYKRTRRPLVKLNLFLKYWGFASKPLPDHKMVFR